MDFQIPEATRQPYTTFEKKEGFIRKYVQDRLSSVLNLFARIRTWASVLSRFAIRTWASIKKLGCACIAYVAFFAWQIIGLILYTIRAFETSISAKHASFQETHIELFRYSAYLELVWLLTSLFNTGLVIIALSKVPWFLGYAVILKELVRLPSFWSLVALTAVTMSGYFVILAIKNHTGMEIALIVAFMVERPVQVILLAVLSFTQVNHSRNNGTSRVFAFIKVNVFLLLVNYFIQFVIGSIQFALDVYGIDKETEISTPFLVQFVDLPWSYSVTEFIFSIGKNYLSIIETYSVTTTISRILVLVVTPLHQLQFSLLTTVKHSIEEEL